MANIYVAGSSQVARRIEPYSPALAAGFLAAIAVILVSLPLRSPHDALMNSATVMIAAIGVTLALSYVWAQLERRPGHPREFVSLCAVAIGLSALAAFAVQELGELERTVSFVTPLAAIQFGATALLAVALSRFTKFAALALAPVLVAVVVLGVVFANDGDQESGRLELPERWTSQVETESDVLI